MTSAEIVIEFIRSRPELEKEVREMVNSPRYAYTAPEIVAAALGESMRVVMGAGVTDEERAKLDRMRGNGVVEWGDVRKAFEEEKRP
jgi:hypothetical protein